MIRVKLNTGEILEGISFIESYTDSRIALELPGGKIVEFSIQNIKDIEEY